MSRFLKDWLTSSNEAHDEKQKVVVQDGETPKEDFSDASNEQSGDADTSKPAVAELDAASDGATEPKTKDQGHQKVTVSAEDSDEDDEQDESEEKDDEDAEETPDADEEAGEAAETAEEEAESAENGEGGVEEGEGTEEEEGAAEETTDAGAAEVEEVKEEVSEDDDTQDEPVEPAEGEAVVEVEAGEAEGDDVPAEGAAEEAGADSGEEDVPAADEGEDEETIPATGEESVEDNEPAPAEGDVPAADGNEVAEAKADAQGEDAETGDVNEGPTQDVPESEGEVSADADNTATAEGEVEGDTAISTEADNSLDVGLTSPEDELVEEMNRVAEDGEHFEKISESLEAYHNLLSQALEDGDGISAITAESIRIGLEHMDESFGGANVVLGMEAFGEYSSKALATRISMEGVGEAIKKTIEVGKKVLNKLFDLIYEAFAHLTSGVDKAKTRLSKLKERVGKLDSEQVSGKVQLSSAKALTVDGEFAGTSLQALRNIKDVAEYMYVAYPKHCAAFAKDFEEIISSRSRSFNAGDRAQAQWSKVVALPGRHLSNVPGKSVLSSAMEKTVIRSHLLPGNRALVTSFDNEKAFSNSQGPEAKFSTFNIAKYVTINFETVEGTKDGGAVDVDIPNKRHMGQVISELEAILKKLDNVGQAKAQYEEVKKTLSVGVKVTYKSTNSETYVNRYVGLSRVMTNPTGPFIAYIGRTVNVYVTFLEHCISAFEKALKAEEGTGKQVATV